MINHYIRQLLQYGMHTGLIAQTDYIYCQNRILEAMELTDYSDPGIVPDAPLQQILAGLLDYAGKAGLVDPESITSRDLFDTRLMGCITPPPSTVTQLFWEQYAQKPEYATSFYYQFSQKTDYIRTYRMQKNIRWKTQTEYGMLDVTINLAKPEKDPKAIAAAAHAAPSIYPKCLLCKENEGNMGHTGRPARQNHRIIPITLDDEPWFLQYSPYTYYNEHCIVLNARHIPMKINPQAFHKLLDFLDLFPHYFIGSNADLPIVGGSILSHDHFQGGRYSFAMERAPILRHFTFAGFPNVSAGIVKWPLSALRLHSKSREQLVALCVHILDLWREYSDESVFVYSHTGNTPHNTITPIARKRNGEYEVDLVLRNNITTQEHPYGVFHPHENLHHIKKENIGLIEVMGLAVLPARLVDELDILKTYMLEKRDMHENSRIAQHADWARQVMARHPVLSHETIDDILRDEVGRVFCQVLKDAGVFKQTDVGQNAFVRFIQSAGGTSI